MVRGVYKSLVVDSAKLLESPTKKLLSYADVLTDQWQYSRGRGHVSYHRNMSPDFNLITGLDPWGRQFVKSIFYDESRKPDKIATWRLIPSISNKIEMPATRVARHSHVSVLYGRLGFMANCRVRDGPSIITPRRNWTGVPAHNHFNARPSPKRFPEASS